jgi:hypothetical protein
MLSMTLPLSAAKVEDYLATAHVTTVEDFLASLPDSLHGSFVLVNDSGSLQRASPERPRQILFGPDARFLIGVGAVAGDPRAEEIEFADFQAEDGRYHFGTIVFSPGQAAKVTHDDRHCLGCHGRTPRPIWGQYPDWAGAYGDDQGRIEPALQERFAAFAAAAPSDPRYQRLHFAAGAGGATFLLVDRAFPYANSAFNHELGNTVALGAVTRMRAQPDWRHLRWATLAASPALGCIATDAWFDLQQWLAAAYARLPSRHPANTDPYAQALRLSGLDPLDDLSLETQTGATTGTMGLWQTGAFQLQEAIAFQLLVGGIADDATLAGQFAEEKETIDAIEQHAQLTGEARAEALKHSYAWYDFFDVFDPVARLQERLDAVCGRLTAHLKD